MKRAIAIILTILFLTSCNILSCSEDSDVSQQESEAPINMYNSLIADTITDGIITDMEVDYWNGISCHKDNMIDKTIFFDGVEYNCSYQTSIINRMNSYTTDKYRSKDGVEFGVRSDTNDLVSIFFRSSEAFRIRESALPETQLPYETLISIATSIASKSVNDLSEYSLVVGDSATYTYTVTGAKREMICYPITYVKNINGYPSSDYITIVITNKGSLSAIHLGDINAFENIPLDFESTTVTNSISNKLDSIYIEHQIKGFNIGEQRIVCTPNREICILSYVSVQLKNESGAEIDTKVALLTVIGHKSE